MKMNGVQKKFIHWFGLVCQKHGKKQKRGKNNTHTI